MPMMKMYRYPRQPSAFISNLPQLPTDGRLTWDQVFAMMPQPQQAGGMQKPPHGVSWGSGPWGGFGDPRSGGDNAYPIKPMRERMQGQYGSEGHNSSGGYSPVGGGGGMGEASFQPAPYVPGSPSFSPKGAGTPVNPQLMGMASQALSPMFQMGLSPDVLFNTLLSALQHQYGGGTGGF